MRRKSLMYKSRVEYGGWTINHVQGCSHGCRYPCYAMALAKRTGRVKTYDEWCRPDLVENSLEVLDREIARLGNVVDAVHLSFTTDPFMWDAANARPDRVVCDLTTRIISRLNNAGIRVTTLTKGVYPDEFIRECESLDPRNRYGISLVSLDKGFQEKWEPGAAPASLRVEAAVKLAEASCATWASVEPYPTPNVDETSADPSQLLDALSFAERVVFGRWNYNSLVNSYPDVENHYLHVAEQFEAWARDGGRLLHIKTGTPRAEWNSRDVLEAGSIPLAGCVVSLATAVPRSVR